MRVCARRRHAQEHVWNIQEIKYNMQPQLLAVVCFIGWFLYRTMPACRHACRHLPACMHAGTYLHACMQASTPACRGAAPRARREASTIHVRTWQQSRVVCCCWYTGSCIERQKSCVFYSNELAHTSYKLTRAHNMGNILTRYTESSIHV